MIEIKAQSVSYSILLSDDDQEERIYPYLKSESGDYRMLCAGPLHGRSYIVGKTNDGRYIISKGNGLSYSNNTFLNTREFNNDTWGLLLCNDAERDYLIGKEVESLGIKTNHMEYVLELDTYISLSNGKKLKPILLQYDVESPYRISDAAFMTHEEIQSELTKWHDMNKKGFNTFHMIAANVLIGNLRTLHDHNILHNAIHEQNYTWALELLDFEIACSPLHPYVTEEDKRHVIDLYPREIIQTYVIINYIAGVLRETINYTMIDALFADYGFDLREYAL
ncbi:MAG: hypothetical protein E7108_07655 [Bacteroidales bacterium]|nr:hypothetical protein [Bacteroidales bacterium]